MKLSELIQLNKILEDSFSSEFERSLELLSVYLDIDSEEIEDKPIKWMDEKLREMHNALTFEYKPINPRKRSRITLANFIDCERYLSNTNDLPKAIAVIMFDFEDLEDILPTINEMDISECLGNLIEYKKFRIEITEMYQSIFADSIEDPIDYTDLTAQEIKEIEEEEKKEKQKGQYAWEMFVYWLADNRIVDVEKVLEFPVIYALNMASMKKMIEV